MWYFLLPYRTHTWRILRSLCLCFLLHVNPVRRRFRHLHVVHGLSYPLARPSLMLIVTLCGVVCNLLSHSLHRIILGENSVGFTLRKKQLRDFSLFYAGCCPYIEWASLVFCCCCCLPTPMTLASGGVQCSRLWSTSQLLRPSDQPCSHSGGVCPQIQG